MKIALIGLGAIGSFLREKIGKDASLKLAGVFDIDRDKATVNSLEELLALKPGLVAECASAEFVRENGAMVLEKTDLLIMSSSALAYEETERSILEAAKKSGNKYYIPSGAITGIDGILAAKSGLEKVELETRKNPKGFARTDVTEEILFEGSAREACKKFPQNVNVAATLSLNGIGFDRTRVKIVSDPEAKANTHTIRAEGSFGKFTIKVEGVPSKNPKTSSLAAMSAFWKIKEIQLGR